MGQGLPKCIDCQVTNCFIRSGCERDHLEKLENSKTMIPFDEGQEIIHEGNPVLGVYFIYSGKVKVTSKGGNGKQQTVRLTGSGDILGHRGYGGEVYPISAITMTPSVVCFFDNDSIYDAFLQNPELTYSLMMYYSKELRRTEARVKYLAQMSVKEKVIEALWFIGRTYGTEVKGEGILIDLKRKEIADLAGVNSDQVSRVLTELKGEGIIRSTQREIWILDPEGLFDLIAHQIPQDKGLF